MADLIFFGAMTCAIVLTFCAVALVALNEKRKRLQRSK